MDAADRADSPAKVSVLSFGCRLNLVESEAMRAEAAAAGERDLLIVNTCAVTAAAAREAERAIRRAKRRAPQLRIVATGCAAEIDRSRFAAMPEVDFVAPNAAKLGSRRWTTAASTPPQAHTRAFVDVQNGCDHRCTFCVIPFGRGPSRSRPLEEVLAEVAALVSAGRQEIVLTGVDLTSWGADLPGRPRLGRLVKAILAQSPHLPRLRLSSLDCAEADEDLLQAFADCERLAPHLHLSLQSGSDLILKRMKRRHSRAEAIALARELRRLRPGMALGADLIVGFPTESEAMFEDTLAFVDECGLSFLHVFPYSPRPGTPAARMPQVAAEAIKTRAARLRAKAQDALARRLASRIGEVMDVLVESGDRGHAEDFVEVLTPPGLRRGEIVKLVAVRSTGRAVIGDFPRASRTARAAPSYAEAAAPSP